MEKKLVIFSSIPGSGKSTYVKNNLLGAYVCSADHYFIGDDGVYRFNRNALGQAHGQCFANFMEALDAGMELIVIDNTNTTMKEISTYAKPAQERGYAVEIVTLEADVETACARNVHGVPLDAIQKMADRIKNTSKLLNPAWKHTVINTNG